MPVYRQRLSPPLKGGNHMHSHANDVQWLLDHAMLEEAKAIAARFSGQGRMWQHPYAQERPRAAAAKASVWFTAYPAAVITREGESVLQTLGSEELWQAFQTIGIQALHNGPMKVAGGIRVGASQR